MTVIRQIFKGGACGHLLRDFRKFLIHIFLKNRERNRASFKYFPVEFLRIKIFPQSFLPLNFQIVKIQISYIIFQIVTGSFYNVLIDFLNSMFVGNSEGSQERCSSFRCPALVMYAYVGKRIDTEIYTSIQPAQSHKIRGSRIINIFSGILITAGLSISSPSLHIAAAGDQIADIRGIAVSEKNSLIKMTGKSFVGKGGK